MIKPEPQFPDNTRVKLRDGVNPSFYLGLGFPGNEGYIREHTTDKYGFQQVLIEWDKDHWSYNGVPDGWTWESHFERVENETMSADDPVSKAIAVFTEELSKALSGPIGRESKPSPDEVSEIIDADLFESGEDVSDLSYFETLEKAAEAAETADGFVLIAVKQEKTKMEGVEQITPVVYHAAKSLRGSLICSIHVGHWVSDFTERLATERIYGPDPEDNG